MTYILKAAQLFTPVECVEQPLVFVEQGRILAITSSTRREIPRGTRVVDLASCILAPGYVDMHTHGGAGHDVMEASAEGLPAVERLLYRHGVTAYLPTTITAPLEATVEALDRLADAIEGAAQNDYKDRARPVGIHLEGPFISHARPGVHPVDNLLPPTLEVLAFLAGCPRAHQGAYACAGTGGGARCDCRGDPARGLREPGAFRRRFGTGAGRRVRRGAARDPHL